MEGQLGLFPSYFQTKLTLGASGFEPHSPFLGCWCHSLAYLGHQDLDFASMARCPPLKRCERRFLGILSILSQVVKVSGAGTRTSARSRIIGSGPSQPCGVCACLCVCTCVCGKERGAAACSELAQNPSWALSGNPQKCLCSGHSAAQLPANPHSESAPSAR